MALSVVSNYAANVAHRYLQKAGADASRSAVRLASGVRAPAASDDPSSVALGLRLRSEIASLKQGALNIAHAASALQVADGALETISQILLRMKSLAEESASGQLTDASRNLIDVEFNQLKQEVDRIGSSTKFGGKTLFGQSLSLCIDPENATDGTKQISIQIPDASAAGLGLLGAQNASSLAGYWDFRIGGSELSDLSGNGNDLILGGDAQVANINGQRRLVVDGSNSYAVAQDAGASALDVNAEITLEVGLQSSSYGQKQSWINIFGKTHSHNELSYALMINTNLTPNVTSDDMLYFGVRSPTGSDAFKMFLLSDLPNIFDGLHHDIAASFSADMQIKLFVDGIEVSAQPAYQATAGSPGINQTDAPLYIGTSLGHDDRNFTGSISYARIWSRALPQSEIQKNTGPTFFFGDSEYSYVSGTFDYNQALSGAQASGGRLLAVESAAEGVAIANWLASTTGTNGNVWQAISDAAGEGVWRYTAGPNAGQEATYTNWAAGEPNNVGDEDHAWLFFQSGAPNHAQWADAQATNSFLQRGYVIEKTSSTAVSLATQSAAASAIDLVSGAISRLASMRATLGAGQNRIEVAGNFLASQLLDVESARSGLMDIDVASEMAAFVSSQILQEAGVSMLSQANRLPQGLLKLLQ
jgi:flagellin-like hook-associated protein FlgL